MKTSDVEKIANLAHLSLRKGDVPAYARDLSRILDLVEQMNAMNTDDVEPMAHPLNLSQRLRADEAVEKNRREHFQTVAPRTEAGLYLVPKVIE
ncbi:MAG: Asp-tRNA(Asn)/Glu-tRNA(Gln) amidotransferase subunit GatC [Gammaproteobacteria bacterium]|nr:Asp-tRNA(Asn)/Glu-tRNA(Gln) amidotransferase subunit GatC [Gammaproteobacteria bacterium]